MVIWRNVSRILVVAMVVVVNNVKATNEKIKEAAAFVCMDAPYGRAIFVRAASKSLENNGVTGYKRILGEASAATAARSCSQIIEQSRANQPITITQVSTNAGTYFVVDSSLRAIEQQAAHYGISSKTIVTQSKKVLPEVLGDFVEAIAPAVGEIVHGIVCDSVIKQAQERAK